MFAAWTAGGEIGVLSGHRIVGRRAWYWAALARVGRPLLHVTDFDVPRAGRPVHREGRGAVGRAPLRRAARAVVGRQRDLRGRARRCRRGARAGVRRSDARWRSTSSGTPRPRRRRSNRPGDRAGIEVGYEQLGVVHGAIDMLGEAAIELTEVPAHRWHRWVTSRDVSAGLGPLVLPAAVAHTGVRAPFAFPDGSTSDLVLTPARLEPTSAPPDTRHGRSDVRRTAQTPGSDWAATCSMASPNSSPSSIVSYACSGSARTALVERDRVVADEDAPAFVTHPLQDHRRRLGRRHRRVVAEHLVDGFHQLPASRRRARSRRGASSSARSRCRCGPASRPTP